MEDFEPAEFGPNVEVGGKGEPFKVRFVGKNGNFRMVCNTSESVYCEEEYNNWILNGRCEKKGAPH